MGIGWKDFAVPEEFTPAGDGSLVAFLAENAASAVRIDVGALRRVDTMLVELLLCGAASWAKRGRKFQVTGVSAAHEEVFLHLGITVDLLERSVAA
jgi:anti-anti-sigma regulatory factor